MADLQPTRGHEQAGRRAVLVVSNETFNRSETVIAMAMTGQAQRAPFPLTYKLDDEVTGRRSWVKISQIRTLSTERLAKRIGRAPDDVVDKIIEGLNDIIQK